MLSLSVVFGVVLENKNTAQTASLCGISVVEARRIELLSENRFIYISPSAFCHLRFPLGAADKQAATIGML